MCDAGDIVDAAGAVLTGGGTLAYKAITGEDVPGAKLIKGAITSPNVPKLDPLKPPPPPPDPTEMFMRRTLAEERRKAAASGGLGSPGAIAGPKAGGY